MAYIHQLVIDLYHLVEIVKRYVQTSVYVAQIVEIYTVVHMPIGYPVPQQPPTHPHYVPLPVPSPTPPVIGGAPVADGFVVSHESHGSK